MFDSKFTVVVHCCRRKYCSCSRAKFVGDAARVESVAVAARVESVLFVFYYASCTVHPVGIPLMSVLQPVILAAFTNVPVDATPYTQ